MQPIASAAMKAGLGGAALVVIFIRVKHSKRPLPWFGLTKPPLVATLGFIAVYLAWMAGTDALTHWRGPWDFRPWHEAPLLASALRIVAVCVFGPFVEEFIFRGMLFAWLQERTRTAITIFATALGWSLLHYNYPWWVIAIIFVDGLILGLARWRTRSVLAPATMHMLFNLYAIW